MPLLASMSRCGRLALTARSFQLATDHSPFDYVIRLRIEFAKGRLLIHWAPSAPRRAFKARHQFSVMFRLKLSVFCLFHEHTPLTVSFIMEAALICDRRALRWPPDVEGVRPCACVPRDRLSAGMHLCIHGPSENSARRIARPAPSVLWSYFPHVLIETLDRGQNGDNRSSQLWDCIRPASVLQIPFGSGLTRHGIFSGFPK